MQFNSHRSKHLSWEEQQKIENCSDEFVSIISLELKQQNIKLLRQNLQHNKAIASKIKQLRQCLHLVQNVFAKLDFLTSHAF